MISLIHREYPCHTWGKKGISEIQLKDVVQSRWILPLLSLAKKYMEDKTEFVFSDYKVQHDTAVASRALTAGKPPRFFSYETDFTRGQRFLTMVGAMCVDIAKAKNVTSIVWDVNPPWCTVISDKLFKKVIAATMLHTGTLVNLDITALWKSDKFTACLEWCEQLQSLAITNNDYLFLLLRRNLPNLTSLHLTGGAILESISVFNGPLSQLRRLSLTNVALPLMPAIFAATLCNIEELTMKGCIHDEMTRFWNSGSIESTFMGCNACVLTSLTWIANSSPPCGFSLATLKRSPGSLTRWVQATANHDYLARCLYHNTSITSLTLSYNETMVLQDCCKTLIRDCKAMVEENALSNFDKARVLFVARYKEPDSPWGLNRMPLDLFKVFVRAYVVRRQRFERYSDCLYPPVQYTSFDYTKDESGNDIFTRVKENDIGYTISFLDECDED